MHRTKIDWPGLDYAWNPIIGCKRNCKKETHGFDCYAKKLNQRFHWIKDWTKPEFFPEKLNLPHEEKKSATWFVGSLTDIRYWSFGWMDKVISVCEECKWHKFMFLTKSPDVYNMFTFPLNCWLGLTITSDNDVDKFNNFINMHDRGNHTFLSIEPLLGPVNLPLNETTIELVIVGADTSKNPLVPKQEWIDSIKHDNIHFKENIHKYLNEETKNERDRS